MNLRLIIGILSFCLAMTGTFVGNMLGMAMIGEINRKRKNEEVMSYFGFTPSKTLQIFREYRSLYPKGRLHIYFLTAFAIVIVSMITVAFCIGILG